MHAASSTGAGRRGAGSATLASAPLLVPVRTARRSIEISSQIKEAIFTGSLRRGDRLPPERVLAKTFQVSPVVVREAVHMLEAAGLLSVRRGAAGGAFVAEITHRPLAESLSALLRLGGATLQQIGETRLVLEPEVAAFAAARQRHEDLALLKKNLDETAAVLHSTRKARLLNLQFHKLLVGITRNPFLTVCLTSLVENLETSACYMDLALDVVASTLDHHREIYRAVAGRNATAANRHMHRHILHIQRKLERCATAG